VIFVDFIGAAETFAAIRDSVQRELGRVLRVPPDSIAIRRIVSEDGAGEADLWVELSSEEQVYRRGREIAAALTSVVQEHTGDEVWVMFRVVPLRHAFLNGQPRSRGGTSADQRA